MPGPPPAPPTDPDVPARVRLPLLTLITQQSLDEDYQVAAERRAAGGPLPPRRRPLVTAAVVVAAFGVLASVAFAQTSRNADVDDASRATLIERIQTQRDRLAQAQTQAADLRDATGGLEQQVRDLTDQEQTILVRNRRVEARTGFVSVTGPGVRVTVSERPDAEDGGQVQAEDLAALANALWAAGAEAVAINGRRLTTVSPIVTSGAAIEVNGSGVAPPYEVEGIGDNRTLGSRLLETRSGRDFVATANFYGFGYDVDNVDRLTLTAAPSGLLRLQSAQTAHDTTPATPGEQEDSP